ncbi:MAG: DUF5302 domain-containing protein [Actinobacteria bacterium]|jgi:hypothetical protein|nr:DUF5302 domain-containing protein [Actinomycetota bacterium]
MATTPPPPHTNDEDETRVKYEAALEAKKHKSGHGSAAPGTSGGPVKEHSSRSGGKREFRRKSGG